MGNQRVSTVSAGKKILFKPLLPDLSDSPLTFFFVVHHNFSVGVMRCKDCFLKHCRDHMSNGPEDGCGVCGEKTELLAEGIDLVTTRKRKPNNPNQAVQSRCAVCRAKTCFCCSACGFEPEIPLCDVTTGRNCLAIHTTEHHSCKHEHHS